MGTRAGEKISLYLRKEDFVKYGFTPGCRGCVDIASGKQRAVEARAPHTRACRCRMETCVQEGEPERWAQYLRRKGAEVAAAAPEPSPPAASSGSGGRGQEGSQDLAYRLCNVDVSEVFSPPRVCAEATKFGLVAGDAMDLTTGWDFTRRGHQLKAERLLDQQKPFVLIGSPPCTAFTQLQSQSPASENKGDASKSGHRSHAFCSTAL